VACVAFGTTERNRAQPNTQKSRNYLAEIVARLPRREVAYTAKIVILGDVSAQSCIKSFTLASSTIEGRSGHTPYTLSARQQNLSFAL
jgi:hypothetical protein